MAGDFGGGMEEGDEAGLRPEGEDIAAGTAVSEVVGRPDAMGGERGAEDIVADGLRSGGVV